MSYEESEKALQSHFNTNFGASYLISWPNIDFDINEVADDTTWLKFMNLTGNSSQADLANDPRFRHPGTLKIEVHAPLGKGEQEALSVADEIANTYRAQSIQGHQFRAPEVSKVGRTDDGYYRVDVKIRYYRDETFNV